MTVGEAIALIGAICTLFSGLVVWIADRYFTVRRASFKTIEQGTLEKVQGKWTGIYSQILNGEHIAVPLTLTIKVEKHGKIKGDIYFASNSQEYFINVSGGFYTYNFLKLEYRNKDLGINQFGSFVLQLNANANKLTGCFVGHGNIGEKVISGDVVFNKA